MYELPLFAWVISSKEPISVSSGTSYSNFMSTTHLLAQPTHNTYTARHNTKAPKFGNSVILSPAPHVRPKIRL
jgi:hypothetical protein